MRVATPEKPARLSAQESRTRKFAYQAKGFISALARQVKAASAAASHKSKGILTAVGYNEAAQCAVVGQMT
jgi:hypothetical protein